MGSSYSDPESSEERPTSRANEGFTANSEHLQSASNPIDVGAEEGRQRQLELQSEIVTESATSEEVRRQRQSTLQSQVPGAEASDQQTVVQQVSDSIVEMTDTEKLNKIEAAWKEAKIQVPRITVYELKDGDQWSDWSFKMRWHLECHQLEPLIERKLDDAARQTDNYKRFNKVIVMNIGMNLSPAIRGLVIGADPNVDAVTVWTRLCNKFEGQGTVQAIRCFAKISRLMSERSGSAAEAVSAIREVKQKFDAHKDDGEALWKAILINSLPNDNETLQTILSTQPESKSLEDLFDLAVQSEQLTAVDDLTNNKALANRIVTKQGDRGGGNERPTCFECHQVGHFKKQCEKYKKRIRSASYSNNNNNQNRQQQQQSGPKYSNSSNHNKNKKFKSNCAIVKDTEEEELDLNPRSFSKLIGAHLVYRPTETEQAAHIEDDEELDLNPTSFDSQLDWKMFDEPDQKQSADSEPVDRQVNEDSCDSQGKQEPEKKVVARLSGKPAGSKAIKTIADSGCNTPMFKTADGISNFKEGGGPLYTASDQPVPVDGIGDKLLHTSLGKTIKLKGVIVSSRLSGNFLAVCVFDKAGYRIIIEDGFMRFYRNKTELVMIAQLNEEDLYEVLLKDSVCYVVFKTDDAIREWHSLLSHVGIDSIRRLSDRLNINVPIDYKLECITCLKGKMIRSAFDGIRVRADRPLKVVHTDLSGIIRIPNRQGYKYFLLFLDDYSRKTFVYLLKSKEDVYKNFVEFKQMIEKQMDVHINKLKSDGGGEFKNQKFDKLCKKTGMVQQFTAPRCPQQNGGPERLNRTIETMARCLLIESGLDLSFWPFAVLYAVFIKDRVPHKALDGAIPLEVFYDTVVDYFKIPKFGCSVIYLVDDNAEITKFDPTGEDGLFLGVPQDFSQGSYYVYSLSKRRVIVRRHVYFLKADENQLKDSSIDALKEARKQSGEFQAEMSDPKCLAEAAERMGIDFVETDYVQTAPDDDDDQQISSGEQQIIPDDQQVQSTSGESVDPPEDREHQSEGHSQQQQQGNHPAEQFELPPVNDQDQLQAAGDPQHKTPTRQQQARAEFAQLLASRPPAGTELKLTASQLNQLKKQFDDLETTFVRPVNTGARKPGAGIYRVNAIRVPKSPKQIGQLPEHKLWEQAMNRELESMDKNGVWKEVDRPKNTKILPLIWVYRVKFLPDGSVDKYKARLCVLGNQQKASAQDNVYAPVMNDVSLRILLAIGVHRRASIHHVDVETAFLHSEIEEEVYVEYPQGMARVKGKCLRLRKSMYGLRSSPLSWYKTITKILRELGFHRMYSDPCVFFKWDGDLLTLIGVHVDDLIAICDDDELMEKLKIDINRRVPISDKGPITQFLNLEISYNRSLGVLKMSQTEYLRQILEQFGMSDCSGKRTVCPSGAVLFESFGKPLADTGEYKTLVGILIYISIRTRPDLKFIVSRLCQFMSNPTEYHMSLAKHVLRYIKQTIDYALYYTAEGESEIQVDCDADFSNDKTTSRSITGVCTQLFGNLVEWISCKQSTVASSTCHAELKAMGEGVDSLIYVRSFLEEITDVSKIACRMYCDNQSALQSTRTGGKYENNKSHRILVHRIKEALEDHRVAIHHKSTGDMLADMFTKSLPADQLHRLLNLINVF